MTPETTRQKIEIGTVVGLFITTGFTTENDRKQWHAKCPLCGWETKGDISNMKRRKSCGGCGHTGAPLRYGAASSSTEFKRRGKLDVWKLDHELPQDKMIWIYPMFSEPPMNPESLDLIRYGDFVIDIDSGDKALNDAIQIIQWFQLWYGITSEQWKIFLSGKKGVHLELSENILGMESGSTYLPLVYKRLAQRLEYELPITLDTSMYNMGTGKPYRQPNIMRTETRTCKRQIIYGQLSIIETQEQYLAACSEPGPTWEPENTSLCPRLAKDMQKYLVESEASWTSTADRPDVDITALLGDTPPCIEVLRNLTKMTSNGALYNDIAMRLTSYAISAGMGVDEFLAFAKVFIENYPTTCLGNSIKARYYNCRNRFENMSRSGSQHSCGSVLSLRISGFECNGCALHDPLYGLDLSGFDNPPLPDGASLTPLPTPATTISSTTPWEPLVSVDIPLLPPIKRSMMPDVLADQVLSVAEQTETPPELAFALGLATAATAFQKKYVIETTAPHTEQLSIYAVAALESGNRKSAVEKIMVSPLRRWEVDKKREIQSQIEEATVHRDNEDTVLKGLKRRLGNKAEKENIEDIKKQIFICEQALTEVPVPPRVWEQDITPEHLGTVMHDHNECMGVFSSEGGIFETLGGRYNNGISNIDLFLQSHSGDPVRVSRGSRPTVNLTAPALSMGISPQPSVLRSMSDSPGFRGRGLLARFIYFLPASPLGIRKLINLPAANLLADMYYTNTITAVLNESHSDEPHVIKMSKDAYNEWITFSLLVEYDMRDGRRFAHIKDWAGKLPGLIARIAGIYHCLMNGGDRLSRDTMCMALDLSEVIIGHSFAAFDLMSADEKMEHARVINRWIIRKGHTSFLERDCWQSLRRQFQNTDEMRACLNVLSQHSIVRCNAGVCEVNPNVHST